MKVVDYIAEYLQSSGTKHVFGFQGGSITPLIDAIGKTGSIEYVQNYHEQASAFCADAYARISGKLGIAIGSNGPGFTNLISGIANAYLDSIPCLFITGQVNTTDINISENIRQNGFQEVGTIDIVKPITKYAVTIKHSSRIKFELDKAIHIATSRRKGAVLIDLPLDIQFEEIDKSTLISYVPQEKDLPIDTMPIQTTIAMIESSERPLVLIGGGVRNSGAVEELNRFIALTAIPTVSTLMGLDVFTPNNYGFCGIYGNTYANLSAYNSDLLLVLGSRLSKRQFGKSREKYAPHARIIHVDIDENEFGHSVDAEATINADIRLFLRELNKAISLRSTKSGRFSKWLKKLDDWKIKYAKSALLNSKNFDPVQVVAEISRTIPNGSIICSDVGQNQMWLAQGFELKYNQRILNSGGLGCMGFSLPAAIGAKVASPQSTVAAFMGDGGFQMNLQELQLIAQRQPGIKCIVFNNHTLGMIKEMQKKFFNENYLGTEIGYQAPNLRLLADAYGLRYLKIQTMRQLDFFSDIWKDNDSYIIEIEINQENTYVLNRHNEERIYGEIESL